MKPIHFCRCGYSAGDHPRTAQCSEGRQTIAVPADATPEQVQAAISNALWREMTDGAAGFAGNGTGRGSLDGRLRLTDDGA